MGYLTKQNFLFGLLLMTAGQAALGQDFSAQSFTSVFPPVGNWAVLTIAGQNYWHQQRYDRGETPTLWAVDSAGAALPDGEYTYDYKSFSGPAPGNSYLTDGTQLVQTTGTAPPEIKSGVFRVDNGAVLPR